MARPLLKDGKSISFCLQQDVIKLIRGYAQTSDQSCSEFVQTLLVGALSNNSNIGLIKLLEKEIEVLTLKNKDLKQIINNNDVLINKKLTIISKAKTETKKFSEINSALEIELEEKKKHFLQILTTRLLAKEDMLSIKKFAMQHSILLNQKYSWEELLTKAMNKAGVSK